MALNNIQQQVITSILERKRLNTHHLNENDEKISTSIKQPYTTTTSLQLPDKWREYLSSAEWSRDIYLLVNMFLDRAMTFFLSWEIMFPSVPELISFFF